LRKDYDKTEDDLKALQSVGQIIGEVLRRLDEERCESCLTLSCSIKTLVLATEHLLMLVRESVIVKASSGPRYVVGCRNKALLIIRLLKYSSHCVT